MHKKNTCILLYPNVKDAWHAIQKLQKDNFNLATVSIISNKKCNKELNYTWDNLGIALKNKKFITHNDIDSLIVAGAIVELLTKEKNTMDLDASLSDFGLLLFQLGISRNSIDQYEKEIETGKILLIVSGKRDVVEQSCDILHSKLQQVTVHIA